MNYLVDTQIILWSSTNNARITQRVRELLANKEGRDVFFFSQISLFEIAIKQRLGKLPELQLSPSALHAQLIEDGYAFLPITNAHINAYASIPLHENHRDPFDRLLLATALQENCTLISADEKFGLYTSLVPLVMCA